MKYTVPNISPLFPRTFLKDDAEKLSLRGCAYVSTHTQMPVM